LAYRAPRGSCLAPSSPALSVLSLNVRSRRKDAKTLPCWPSLLQDAPDVTAPHLSAKHVLPQVACTSSAIGRFSVQSVTRKLDRKSYASKLLHQQCTSKKEQLAP
jgi:hypothetical protein